MRIHTDSEYITLATEYRELKKKEKEIEAQQNALKEKGAIFLHDDKMNENIVPLADGENWKFGYGSKITSKPDYKLLLETVGPAKYKEIVTEKESVFITIKKSGKTKIDTSILNEKPVNDDPTKPSIPTGTILS